MQPVNGYSKNSIFSGTFFSFLNETPLKDFSFYSPILLTVWLKYLHIKESFMYLFSQVFFKTPHKTIKSQEKFKKKNLQ